MLLELAPSLLRLALSTNHATHSSLPQDPSVTETVWRFAHVLMRDSTNVSQITVELMKVLGRKIKT
jgi:hypothetical protein